MIMNYLVHDLGKLLEIEHAIPCTKMNHRGNVASV